MSGSFDAVRASALALAIICTAGNIAAPAYAAPASVPTPPVAEPARPDPRLPDAGLDLRKYCTARPGLAALPLPDGDACRTRTALAASA